MSTIKTICFTLLGLGLGILSANGNLSAQSLDHLVDEHGYISGKTPVQESFNAEGWRVVLDPDGTPRFVRDTDPVTPLSAPPPIPFPDDVHWDAGFGAAGTIGSIRVVALSGCDDIYVGGSFTTIGGVEARNIARWDGSRWHSVGENENNGVDGTVYAITVDGVDVYVGGRFDSAGTLLVYNLARWDGLKWNGVGGGVDSWDEWDLPAPGTVYAIAVEGSDVYVGGDFDSVGTGITAGTQFFARNIAVWSRNSWKAMGAGLEGAGDRQPTDMGTVRAIDFGFDGIYAAGRFVVSGNETLNGLARWNGSIWLPVGSMPQVNSGKVDIFTMQVKGADVYIGGNFDRVGEQQANNIAVWAGLLQRWYTLGEGSTDTVRSLYVDGERIYASGSFRTPSGDEPNHVAVWDEGAWRPLGQGANNGTDGIVWSIVSNGEKVYMSGPFRIAGPATAAGVALWNVSMQTWKPLNQGIEGSTGSGGVNGPVYAVALTDDYLYIGGRFSTVGLVKTNSLARWNRQTRVWSPLGGGIAIDSAISTTLLPFVRAITVDGPNVYVGGRFDFAAGVRANNVARWNGTSWAPLDEGIGLNGQGGPYDSVSTVYALDAADGKLYVGGEFIRAGGELANRIAKWDEATQTWSPLGGGIGGSSFNTRVNAVAVSGEDVYIGGTFVAAGSVRANNIARFDGTNWSALGRGINNEVMALAADDQGNLYVGGNFSRAGNVEGVGHIARWDGTEWYAMGAGMTGFVRALAVGPNGVYAVGDFTVSGIEFTSHVARWDGTSWVGLGSGLQSESKTTIGLAVTVEGNEVFVGGFFDYAGAKSSLNLGRWTKPGNGIVPIHPENAARSRASATAEVGIGITLLPNPVVNSARFSLDLPDARYLRLALYSVSGEQTAVVHEGILAEGRHEIMWSAESLPSGLYTWKLTGDGTIQSGSVVVRH